MSETPYAVQRRLAREAALQANFPKALRLYTKALRKHRAGVDPDDLEEVYTSRAVCLLELGKYQEAAQEAQLAITARPSYAKVEHCCGSAA